MGQFDLVAQAEEDAKNSSDSSVAYVSDLDELYAILSNPIAKRKVGIMYLITLVNLFRQSVP